jgi:lysophospholipase L1-like esterase
MKGYPFLKRESKAIKDAGVAFWDLSMVFEQTEETLYRDDCCHFTRKGYEIIAGMIAARIEDYFGRRSISQVEEQEKTSG